MMFAASNKHHSLAATRRAARLTRAQQIVSRKDARRVASRLTRTRGATLLELAVVVTLIGILVAFVVPSFTRVTEQNRLDAAAQYLRSIWSAQRVHWIENRTFATSLATLNDMGLIDPSLLDGSDGYFVYNIGSADPDAFAVTATRSGSGSWSGTLTITEAGEVTGHVTDGSNVLVPPGI